MKINHKNILLGTLVVIWTIIMIYLMIDQVIQSRKHYIVSTRFHDYITKNIKIDENNCVIFTTTTNTPMKICKNYKIQSPEVYDIED